ncbi:F0F1 ATP synthase subunit gamma, partial [bacterium]|nr:F0F1 ATP synthase subunit gamma [bacterium]
MAGSGIKAINKRIVSIKSTQQITKAMKMVAAAKLRRSQERLMAARPYSGKLLDLLGRLADTGGSDHPLFQQREIKNRIVVVVTSDKGLCGGYNMNVIRRAQALIDESVAQGIETDIYAVGRKSRDYFNRRDYNVVVSHDDFGGAASDDQARKISDYVTARFISGDADDVKLVYAEFVSVMTQKP